MAMGSTAVVVVAVGAVGKGKKMKATTAMVKTTGLASSTMQVTATMTAMAAVAVMVGGRLRSRLGTQISCVKPGSTGEGVVATGAGTTREAQGAVGNPSSSSTSSSSLSLVVCPLPTPPLSALLIVSL